MIKIIEDSDKQRIIDRVKTFEDACIIAGKTPSEVIGWCKNESAKAFEKLKLIISVLNEGWTPNYSDLNEYKYCPYFSCASGFGFSGSYMLFVPKHTSVGSLLCFKSRELSDYAGRTFLKEYEDYKQTY